MPHGPEHLVSSYHDTLEQQRQLYARELSLLFGTLDRVLKDNGADRLEVEHVGRRVRLIARVGLSLSEIKVEGMDRDPFIAEEVKRQYIAAGFDDVTVDFGKGLVTFVAFEDSGESKHDRILRLLREALQDHGAEG